MEYQFIKTPKDYKKVAHRIEELKDAEPNTSEARELKRLVNKIIRFVRLLQLIQK